jgi:hypothetical protein
MEFHKRIMRTIILGILFIVSGRFSGRAQDAIQTMLQQVAALEDFIGTAEQGYQVEEQDIYTIGAITGEEFLLHQAFFNSLVTVNPVVNNMPAVTDINKLYGAIINQLSASLKNYRQSVWITAKEMQDINKVYMTISDRCGQDINALQLCLTNNNLKMTDGERIRYIGAIHTDIKEIHGFVQAFQVSTDLLIVRRQEVTVSAGVVRNIYGIQ